MKSQRCKTGDVPSDAIFAVCDDCLLAFTAEVERMKDNPPSEAQKVEAAALFIPPEGMKVAMGPSGGVLVENTDA